MGQTEPLVLRGYSFIIYTFCPIFDAPYNSFGTKREEEFMNKFFIGMLVILVYTFVPLAKAQRKLCVFAVEIKCKNGQ
ncbi:MAG: hypothetical protein GY749_33115 [Desulfobacteraceae bacterium]|nr:hypothetical protein [Desulfobacteraceae bacterium]